MDRPQITHYADPHKLKRIEDLEAELALLRKVADAARGVAGFDPCHDANSYWSIKKLSNALDEYDKAKEGQDGKLGRVLKLTG